MELFKKAIEESTDVQLKIIKDKITMHIKSERKNSNEWARRLNFLMSIHDILSIREMQNIKASRNGDTKD